jgi:hypothetical protein
MPVIHTFRDALWPGGQLKGPNSPRTHEEKTRTRDEANRKLSALVPGMCSVNDFHFVIIYLHAPLDRFGRKYDWAIQCTTRCAKDLCGFTESPFEPAYCIYNP